MRSAAVFGALSTKDAGCVRVQPETIERACKCGCEQTIIKKRIVSLPRVFIFHIKRFVHLNFIMKKINSKVTISNEIALGTQIPVSGLI